MKTKFKPCKLCDKESVLRGFCKYHYSQWYYYGDAEHKTKSVVRALLQNHRFMDRLLLAMIAETGGASSLKGMKTALCKAGGIDE